MPHVSLGVRLNRLVNRRNLGVQLVEQLLRSGNGFLRLVRIQARYAGCDGLYGVLELLHAIAFIGQQRDAQRSDSLRELFLDNSQRGLAFGGHKYSFALSQVVTDDVGDGVCFSSARGALDHNAVVALQLLDDGHLLVVVRHGKVQLTSVLGAVTGRQATEGDFRASAHGVVPRSDKTLDDGRNRGGHFELLLQATDVFQQDVARTLATKDDPASCDQKLF